MAKEATAIRSTHPAGSPTKAASPPPAPAPATPAADPALTPAMRQYLEQKAAVPDAILLFRMGDFYETFFDDARTIARELGLTLTARNKGDANPIPLAGVPYHAVDAYVARLVRAGYKVAISEQLEDPKQARGVVRRDIVRVITPGTLTDESLLEETSDNWLAAICVDELPASRNQPPSSSRRVSSDPRARASLLAPTPVGLARVELASGRFFASMLPRAALIDELARLRPAEVLVVLPPIDRPDPLAADLAALPGTAVTPRSPHAFDPHLARQRLCEHFRVAGLEGFGFDEFDASLRAAGALIDYLQETQKSALAHILRIEPHREDAHLAIDAATLRSLEVERTYRDGSRHGSLLGAVDRTVNPMGARRLREWLCYPLRDPAEIQRRQAAIGALLDDRLTRSRLRALLRETGDVERIAARLGVGRAGPRDLVVLGRTVARFAELRSVLQVKSEVLRAKSDALEATDPPGPDNSSLITHHSSLLTDLASATCGLEPLADHLACALRDDAPPTLRDGGVIAPGFDAELDRLRAIGADGQRWLAEYQAAEAARTGIPSLKVGYNQVFGYYIEITHSHRQKVPPDYVRKQTVRNAERYITDELKRYESESLSAHQRAIHLETELFARLCARAAEDLPRLQQAAAAIAQLDVLAALAELAAQRGYCRPEIVLAVEPGRATARRAACVLEIEDGRHPVLEQTLGERFVPNDCRLAPDGDRLLIITGPNMAGKSTYIRQVALLVLLAQTGSWVPARAMRWVPADRLFARVGASDELARGQSTFMVEMLETARILHGATPASLVILDEIGRGTSTFDGLALAWAITEHLAARVGCRALFATHYHELTELAATRAGIANCNVAVREQRRPDGGEEVVFLHRILPGGTDKSYGIHVARMAGIPPSVVARSREVLGELEQSFAAESRRVSGTAVPAQGTLFPPVPPPPAWWEALCDEILRLDLERTTPIEALTLLHDVRARLRQQRSPQSREPEQ